MKERKRERERERESGLGREVRGPSPVHSPVLRSWSLFIILFRNAGQHKSLLFRDQPPPHPDRPAVHPHPGAGLSSPAVPLSLSILLLSSCYQNCLASSSLSSISYSGLLLSYSWPPLPAPGSRSAAYPDFNVVDIAMASLAKKNAPAV